MKKKIYLFALLALLCVGCKNASHEKADEHEHEHEDVKFQYTAYSADFELFAEADPFVVGEMANILSHFSTLPNFKAVEKRKITIVLTVNGKDVKQTLENPTRKGIYSFDIKAQTAGKGTLKYIISTEKGESEVLVPEIEVFAEEEAAHEVAEANVISKTNTVVFTKEQSWKVDFSTQYPVNEPFGQIIKTTAQIESAQGDETLISAKTSGMVIFSNQTIFEGKSISAGQTLFSISASGLADNNMAVRIAEAKNNFENAKADYERHKELVKDKIISEKELMNAKNLYENTKVIYENLSQNFNAAGQNVSSPMSGFIKQLFVKNGQFVEAGHPLVTVSQNQTLILRAEVQQKYSSILATIQSANIRTVEDNKTYSFEQLNGKVLSFGKSTSSDNYLLPVTLQIDNKGNFVSGGFVEVYLKTLTNAEALTVLNEALLEEQGYFFVFVQITPELFEKREVTIGGTDGLRTEISKGISVDERIVSKGAILVKLAQASGALDAHSGHVH